MKSSTFKFTNTSDGPTTIARKALGLTTNYALVKESADDVVLSNKTADIDAQELVQYATRLIPMIKHDLNIQNPSPVKGGIQYVISDQATLVTTDSDDANFRLDEPIFCQLLIRHPRSGNFTNAVVGAMVQRLISAAQRADGTWRFDDLMRQAERPVVE